MSYSHSRLASLTEIARVKGFTISADSNKALAESLNNCVDPQDPSVNTVHHCYVFTIKRTGGLLLVGGNCHVYVEQFIWCI